MAHKIILEFKTARDMEDVYLRFHEKEAIEINDFPKVTTIPMIQKDKDSKMIQFGKSKREYQRLKLY